MTRPGSASPPTRRLALMLTVATMLIFGLLSVPGMALAGVSGQLGRFAPDFGTNPGQLFNPLALGVDTEDGSVFTTSANEDFTETVVQKFTATGELKGSVSLPGLGYIGIAVDPEAGRFYLLEDEFDGSVATAKKILAFSTTPTGNQLVPAAVPDLPVSGGATLTSPQELAIDPSTGNLVVVAADASEHVVLQRIDVAADGTGTAGPEWTDTTGAVGPSARIAIDEKGVSYIASEGAFGGNFTVASLPAEFTSTSSLTPLPGANAAVQSVSGETIIAHALVTNQGPQIAVSTSPVTGEDTLYWKGIAENAANQTGSVVVEGFSPETEARTVAFGGGAVEGTCRIQALAASIAPGPDGSIVVLDQGEEPASSTQPPALLPIVYKFGAGGSECPDPAAAFQIETEGQVASTASTGVPVTLKGGSELNGTTLEQTTWTIKGVGAGLEEITETVNGATATFDHTFAVPGTYKVRMTIKTSQAGTGTTFSAPVQTLTVSEATTPPGEHSLSIVKAGTGTVECEDEGAGSFGACAPNYAEGHVVKLKAAAGTGFEFEGWSAFSGSGTTTKPCAGAVAECEVKMDANVHGTATFRTEGSGPPIEFALNVTPPSNGSVTCNSGSGVGACAAKYVKGTVVTLTATAAAGFEFAGWTGDCASTGGALCKLTMNAAHTAGATFKAVPPTNNPPSSNPPSSNPPSSNPPATTNTPTTIPSKKGGGGMTPAQKIAAERQKALAKCKKLKGKAKAKCVEKAHQIGKPKPKPKKKPKHGKAHARALTIDPRS